MAARRYFRSSIDELEKLFESSRHNSSVLNEIREELSFRDRPRAKALLLKVDAALSSVRGPGAADSDGRRISEQSALPPPPSGEDQVVVIPVAPNPPPLDRADIPAPQIVPEAKTLPGPDSVLASWLTLEVLTPQPLPDPRDLAAIGRTLVRLEEYPEPWKDRRYWKRGKERAVYWMVYLGELDLEKATAAILGRYPDDAVDERAAARGHTTLAVVVVDGTGRPVEDKLYLSSFAWGYGQVRAGRLRALAGFPDAERAVKEQLSKRLIRQDEEGKVIPLGQAEIQGSIGWLGKVLNLPDDEVIRPGLAIRVPQWGSFSEAPVPELLNSFFIDDLVAARTAIRSGQAGRGLSAYLGLAPERERQDVVKDRKVVAAMMAPERTPLARWPSRGRHPLVLMQQAAINHASAELADRGLIAVNGPPGTGKTTLLRDVIAKVVLDRAIALSRYDKPAQAFTHLTTMKTGNAYTHLYRIDESLIGHEIVIASSNNKAVENISREIPSAEAIASDLDPPARYFRSISDAVAAGAGNIDEGKTWGLAAAVLGNSANRSSFTQSFYWNQRRGMARYLKAAAGVDVSDDDTGDAESEGEQRMLDVLQLEEPPRGEIEALERWRVARSRFRVKLEHAEELRSDAQVTYEAVLSRASASQHDEGAKRELALASNSAVAALEAEAAASRQLALAEDSRQRTSADRETIDRLRPGFFARLFATRSYREWRTKMAAAVASIDKAREQFESSAESVRLAQGQVSSARAKVAESEVNKQNSARALAQIIAVIDSMRSRMGGNLADERYWAQHEDRLQLTSPWIFREWQLARDALFVDAFELHRAFIDAAAKPIRHNLRAALAVMNGKLLRDAHEPARCSLWATLFLVVPAISTTFASTTRLFGPLGREQIGWLLIDEAGQASPQAAVGAIFRARRTIVIGDPMQIPPVVTTSPTLIRSIFAEFKVPVDDWAAPEMSTQTLADRVSWFGTDITTADGDIWVGSPLRVHRRCENPMFKISNHVAYDGMMVYGTKPDASMIGRILGDSHWIDCPATEAEGKWSEIEGRRAVELLRKLLDSGVTEPDIFFITPFRIVAYRLREMIRNDRSIADRLLPKSWEWVRDRVGTTHTFQGKEADTVVLVLGAPADLSAGARRWAGRPPNLLNVAVTRAKRRIYVIGSRDAWKDAGFFSHLVNVLPAVERTGK